MQNILNHLIPTGRFRLIGVLLYSCLILCLQSSFAQRDALKDANLAFEKGNYHIAIIYLDRIEKIHSSGPLLFKRGICHYELNHLDQALMDFQRSWEFGYKDNQVDWYTGLIYHHRGDFVKAAEYYKKYLNSLSDDDELNRQKLRKYIKQCGNAIDLSYKRPMALVENFSKEINSIYDEMNLLSSPGQENKYYFSSNNPKKSISMEPGDFNIYSTIRDDQNVQKPERLPSNVNRYTDEYLQGFSPAGDGIYFLKAEHGGYAMHLSTAAKRNPKMIELPATFSAGNRDVHFYDMNLIVYSDKKASGYGGYDLYMSIRKEGIWAEGLNMGPEINGPYDELSPFLSGDGGTLYFSSNRENSIGGFDVFSSNFQYEANKWSSPENLGIPINSPGDEFHFRPMSDGLKACFSSNRKSALGGFDIFLARFTERISVPQYSGEVVSASYLADSTSLGFAFETELEEDENLELDQLNIQALTSTIALEIKPLYYTESQNLFTKENLDKIDQIVAYLNANPLRALDLEVHVADQGLMEYNLYSSLKIGGRIESVFEGKGIDQSRILIRGLGNNLPVVKDDRNGGSDVEADKYNSRVIFNIINPDGSMNIDGHELPPVDDRLLSLKYELYRALVRDEISYKIQIAVVGQMYRGVALQMYNDVAIEEHEETGLYSYTVGLYNSYAKALQIKRELERNGITDSKVIPYYNGMRVNYDQLTYLIKDHPDLKNLMNYRE